MNLRQRARLWIARRLLRHDIYLVANVPPFTVPPHWWSPGVTAVNTKIKTSI